MMAEDLVEIAFELARRESSRPKSASLRRATSTAYYALFHALAALSADQLIGWKRPWNVFTPVYRSLDHRQTRKALNDARQQGGGGSPLGMVALAFAALQDARNHADYNPEPFPFNRSETIELIGVAKQAVAATSLLSADDKRSLAVKLVIKAR